MVECQLCPTTSSVHTRSPQHKVPAIVCTCANLPILNYIRFGIDRQNNFIFINDQVKQTDLFQLLHSQ
ncbi:hypothetical protein BLOT_000714, partial [Blomia tropicalis]